MISVIIPVYNESESLPLLLERFVNLKLSESFEFIVVDDSSDGKTEDACEPFKNKLNLHFESRGQRLGLASAVLYGFRKAHGDYLVCMDGDGSHPPETIAPMVELLKESPGSFVLASRYVDKGEIDKGWSFIRRLMSRFSGVCTLALTGAKDPMSGYFAMSAAMFSKVEKKLEPRGYKIALEIMVKSAQKVIEVPFKFDLRSEGKSKLNFGVLWAYAVQLVDLHRYRFTHKKSR